VKARPGAHALNMYRGGIEEGTGSRAGVRLDVVRAPLVMERIPLGGRGKE
jgi:hypothetical protein